MPAPGRPKRDSGPLGGQEPQATWGPMLEGLGDGFSWKSQDLEHSAQLARDGWHKAKAAIMSGDYFMVTLDEITYPLIYGWLPLADVLETLRTRPQPCACGADRPALPARNHRTGRHRDRDEDGETRVQGRHSGPARH